MTRSKDAEREVKSVVLEREKVVAALQVRAHSTLETLEHKLLLLYWYL